MQVVPSKRLRQAMAAMPGAAKALTKWAAKAQAAEWWTFADVRKTFGAADKVGEFVVFNVGGHKVRIVAETNFAEQQIYLAHVFDHKDYDRWWKKR